MGEIPGLRAPFRPLSTTTCPPSSCYYFSYWSGVEAEDFELYVRREHRVVIFAFKTENDLFAIFVGMPVEELPQIRRDIEGSMMQAIELVPQFPERVRAGKREERFKVVFMCAGRRRMWKSYSRRGIC